MRRDIKKGRREYRFGDFRFIPDRQLLLHHDNVLRIGSRALELLHLLVSRAGEVVSKEELTRFAWPRIHVHESNLKVNIAALRRALPRARTEPPLITTVPGRGYRFAAPVRVMAAVGADDLPDSVRRQSGELPPATRPIGREDALAELEKRIVSGAAVTVVGPAGVGKTTVAVAAARRVAGHFPDGVHFVDLAALDDSKLVGPAIATALGVEGDFTDLLAALGEALWMTRSLLLLDNCEHVLSATATISEQLRAAVPGLHVLATSREPLRTRNETLYRLSPLDCPEDSEIGASGAMAYSAVRLFVRRAEAVKGYRLDDADVAIVSAICRRLDGIPLAIELAVARLSACDPATLLSALEQSFDPLNLGLGTDRHRTLVATLDWSYRLLSDEDARLFRWLSVFTGSFQFEDILGLHQPGDTSVDEIAARTESLVAKSLLVRSHQQGNLHYRLLDSTRGFAAKGLVESGEADAVLRQFSSYLLEIFERAEIEWQWRAREDWIRRYGARANDLRKAIDWALDGGGAPLVGVRLTAAAIPLWDEVSTVNESRLRVGRALSSDAIVQGRPELRMKLITAWASGLNFSDQLGRDGEAAWSEAYGLAAEAGDTDYQLRALWGLAVLQSFSGQHRQALVTLDRFNGVARAAHERSALPDGDRLKLMTSFYCGNIGEAREGLELLALEHSSDHARSRVVRFQIDRFVGVRVSLAMVRWIQGEHGLAMSALDEALDRAGKLDHLVSQSNALAHGALPLALQMGDLPLAREYAASLTHNLNVREIAIWGPVSRFYDAAIASTQGERDGIDHMRAATAQLIRNGFLVRVPLYLAMTAEAALTFGKSECARATISEAFARSEAQDERWCQPELLRVQALVQWHEGDHAAAEQTLAASIDDARQSGALSFQLRSTTLRAEWLDQLGRQPQARHELAALLARFDPASPSRDVARAAGLLANLEARG